MIRQMFRYVNRPAKGRREYSGRCTLYMIGKERGVRYINHNGVRLSGLSERGPAGWYWDNFLELGYHGPFPNRYAAMVACVLSD